MLYVYLILAALLLPIGFLALAGYEQRRGARFFEQARASFDRTTLQAVFIATHVDFAAFVQDEFRRLSARISHDAAHLSLRIVRSIERLLTRFVKYLRSRHGAGAAPSAPARDFVKTLSDFKGQLESTRPEVPEIH